MREIKFRAWDKEQKVMYEVKKVDFSEQKVFCEQYYLNDWKFSEIELMQFSGLKDKNGIDIYEGDIVECVFATGKEPCKVIEEKGCFWVSQKRMKYLQTEAHDNLYWHNSECEIIGNIYENPESFERENK